MNKCVVMAAAMSIGMFGLVGCDREPEAPPAPAPAASDADQPLPNAARNGVDEAVSTIDAAKTEADSLLARAQQYITEQKFDEAQKVIDQLRALSDKLPDDYKARIDQLVNAFNAAKATGNLPANVPGLGGN
ncbi:MAG TPA: DUF6384 family protein, partial [Tepidisphaeraceae bacterium]|nr:DUF6384 family protein [Tepidisphaeraceae bacterium]